MLGVGKVQSIVSRGGIAFIEENLSKIIYPRTTRGEDTIIPG